MLPVRGLAEWNIRNDTKQAYPVATGLVRGSTLRLQRAHFTKPFRFGSAPLIGLLRKSFNEYRKVYKVMDSALEQYRLDKSDLNFGRAQGAAKLALELSFITADQFVVYMESLIWERNNP